MAKWVLGFLNPELDKLWQCRTPPTALITGTLGRCSTPQEAGPETKRDEGRILDFTQYLQNPPSNVLEACAEFCLSRRQQKIFFVTPNP